eukprot:sb/3469323/
MVLVVPKGGLVPSMKIDIARDHMIDIPTGHTKGAGQRHQRRKAGDHDPLPRYELMSYLFGAPCTLYRPFTDYKVSLFTRRHEEPPAPPAKPGMAFQITFDEPKADSPRRPGKKKRSSPPKASTPVDSNRVTEPVEKRNGCDKQSDRGSDKQSDKQSDRGSDKQSNGGSDRGSDKASDKLSDKLSDKQSDKISDKVSDKMSDSQVKIIEDYELPEERGAVYGGPRCKERTNPMG